MFFCPLCRNKTRVTRTDANWKGGGTRRERRCDAKDCKLSKHGFVTIEFSEAAFQRAQLMDSDITEIKRLLGLAKIR